MSDSLETQGEMASLQQEMEPSRTEARETTEQTQSDPLPAAPELDVHYGTGPMAETYVRHENGTQIRITPNKIFPEQMLAVREVQMQDAATKNVNVEEGAPAIEERAAAMHEDVLAAIALRNTFREFGYPVYPVDVQKNDDGIVENLPFDPLKFGNSFDLKGEAYVIPASGAENLKSLFATPPTSVTDFAQGERVQFYDPAGNMQSGDMLSEHMHDGNELGFTVKFWTKDEAGNKHTHEIMFFYGKEKNSADSSEDAQNDNTMKDEEEAA